MTFFFRLKTEFDEIGSHAVECIFVKYISGSFSEYKHEINRINSSLLLSMDHFVLD